MGWLTRIFWRWQVKEEVWTWLNQPELSQESFVSMMLEIRKEVQDERKAWSKIRELHKIL